MKCPVCKKSIPDDALKCPYCKARTGLMCKKCNTVNSIFDLTCKNCGEEILKLCPGCSAVNFPNAEKCRKCGILLKPQVRAPQTETHTEDTKQPEYIEQKQEPEKDEVLTKIPPSHFAYQADMMGQSTAKDILEESILSENKKIMSLSGARGSGKSVVIKQLMTDLSPHGFNWLYGKCTPLTQLTPGGLLQDVLLNFFNLPNFCVIDLKFKKDAVKYFQGEFPFLTNTEVYDFLNFLYPFQPGNYEDILINKKRTFSLLFKIFEKILELRKFIIVIDNFDFIDGFSYEFLSVLIKQKQIWEKLKLFIVYNDPKPAKGYFYLTDNGDEIYTDLTLGRLDAEQMEAFIKMKEDSIDDFPYLDELERVQIIEQCKGNPAYIEQILDLRFDYQNCETPFKRPDTFAKIVEKRLEILKSTCIEEYKMLVCSALLGDKINLAMLRQVFELGENEFSQLMNKLQKLDYLSPVNEIFCEFKSVLLWETILACAKSDELFIELNTKIYNTLADFTLNANAVIGVIAQNLKHTKLALDLWSKNTRLASYIGDTNLYVISQKQCLALINELDDVETLKTRFNISERLGKLLSDFNPKEAMEFLPDAISNAEVTGDTPREIELLGYMSYCCRKTGNYYGEIECVDKVLEKTNHENRLEIALLKCTKMGSVLKTGNCGEVINTIDNDIMPVFDEYLSKNYTHKNISLEFLFETWLKTYLTLANALILQGNDRSFEILTILFDIIERNQIQDDLFICKCKLALAFANTMRGDTTVSEKLLEEVLKSYRTNTMDNETILQWNLVNIINNFMRKHYDGVQEDLFQIVTFANNCGDEFTKNILKTLLGKLFKDNGQTKDAMGIYTDQITYFAKEKMALGALLTWFLIADAALILEGPHNAIEVAQQALEVAQNPKIDNYFFAVLLRIVIAKACITISDYDTAKIHIETAINVTRKFGMKDLLSRLYLLYGKYFQEIGLVKGPQQMEYLEGAAKMYERASDVVKITRNNHVHVSIEKAKSVLKSFCQLNHISIGIR